MYRIKRCFARSLNVEVATSSEDMFEASRPEDQPAPVREGTPATNREDLRERALTARAAFLLEAVLRTPFFFREDLHKVLSTSQSLSEEERTASISLLNEIRKTIGPRNVDMRDVENLEPKLAIMGYPRAAALEYVFSTIPRLHHAGGLKPFGSSLLGQRYPQLEFSLPTAPYIADSKLLLRDDVPEDLYRDCCLLWWDYALTGSAVITDIDTLVQYFESRDRTNRLVPALRQVLALQLESISIPDGIYSHPAMVKYLPADELHDLDLRSRFPDLLEAYIGRAIAEGEATSSDKRGIDLKEIVLGVARGLMFGYGDKTSATGKTFSADDLLAPAPITDRNHRGRFPTILTLSERQLRGHEPLVGRDPVSGRIIRSGPKILVYLDLYLDTVAQELGIVFPGIGEDGLFNVPPLEQFVRRQIASLSQDLAEKVPEELPSQKLQNIPWLRVPRIQQWVATLESLAQPVLDILAEENGAQVIPERIQQLMRMSFPPDNIQGAIDFMAASLRDTSSRIVSLKEDQLGIEPWEQFTRAMSALDALTLGVPGLAKEYLYGFENEEGLDDSTISAVVSLAWCILCHQRATLDASEADVVRNRQALVFRDFEILLSDELPHIATMRRLFYTHEDDLDPKDLEELRKLEDPEVVRAIYERTRREGLGQRLLEKFEYMLQHQVRTAQPNPDDDTGNYYPQEIYLNDLLRFIYSDLQDAVSRDEFVEKFQTVLRGILKLPEDPAVPIDQEMLEDLPLGYAAFAVRILSNPYLEQFVDPAIQELFSAFAQRMVDDELKQFDKILDGEELGVTIDQSDLTRLLLIYRLAEKSRDHVGSERMERLGAVVVGVALQAVMSKTTLTNGYLLLEPMIEVEEDEFYTVPYFYPRFSPGSEPKSVEEVIISSLEHRDILLDIAQKVFNWEALDGRPFFDRMLSSALYSAIVMYTPDTPENRYMEIFAALRTAPGSRAFELEFCRSSFGSVFVLFEYLNSLKDSATQPAPRAS